MGVLTDTKVWKAKSSQTALIESGERLSADPDKMDNIGVVVGDQVRVLRDESSDMALYTYYEEREETYEYNLRMGYDGRARIGQTSTPVLCDVDSQVPHPTYTDAEAESNSEFVERLDQQTGSNNSLCVLAPHGGMIENYTDEQAERVKSQLDGKTVDAWRCKGWKSGGGAYTRWHITSTEICERSFPLLDDIMPANPAQGFDYAVAFHGMGDDDVVIGGGCSSALKTEIQEAIEAIENFPHDVTIATSGPYAGTSSNNILNRVSTEGVQIEQCYEARRDYGQAIADAVAEVFSSKL